MSIKKKYTQRKKYGKHYTVWFKSGVQSFCLAGEYSATESAWLQRMLAEALINAIAAERPLHL